MLKVIIPIKRAKVVIFQNWKSKKKKKDASTNTNARNEKKRKYHSSSGDYYSGLHLIVVDNAVKSVKNIFKEN